MRLKLSRDDPNAFRCCFCCHVRTGTIILGIWHMIVHMLVLSLFALVLMHPELVQQSEELPNSTNTVDENYFYDGYNWFQERRWTSEDKFIGLLVILCSFFMTVLLVYGSAKGRPGYLMPFFCLQVFDFCISCLTIIGYFSYMPDVKRWIAAQETLPYRDELMKLNGDWLMLVVVAFFVIVMTVKAYFIGVVWACYKYLTQMNAGQLVRTAFNEGTEEDTQMLLPPKYEDAIQMTAETSNPLNLPPPPAYQP